MTDHWHPTDAERIAAIWKPFFDSAPHYDLETLQEIHDSINDYPGGDLDGGDLQAYALEFVTEILEMHDRLAAAERFCEAAREYRKQAGIYMATEMNETALSVAEDAFDAALVAYDRSER